MSRNFDDYPGLQQKSSSVRTYLLHSVYILFCFQKAYPMELHLVHFKTEYGNDIMSAITNEPRGKNDNLAVLGIMFEIQDEDNEGIFLSWQNISVFQMAIFHIINQLISS